MQANCSFYISLEISLISSLLWWAKCAFGSVLVIERSVSFYVPSLIAAVGNCRWIPVNSSQTEKIEDTLISSFHCVFSTKYWINSIIGREATSMFLRIFENFNFGRPPNTSKSEPKCLFYLARAWEHVSLRNLVVEEIVLVSENHSRFIFVIGYLIIAEEMPSPKKKCFGNGKFSELICTHQYRWIIDVIQSCLLQTGQRPYSKIRQT